MSSPLVIALDAMGGDAAPAMVLDGAELAIKRHPQVHFLLFGASDLLAPEIDRRRALAGRVTLREAPDKVASDARPSTAVRAGKQTSMRLAIDAVAAGEASAVVSAGNTGALMAMAKLVFRTFPGISRPAIASFFPSARGETAMLDLGANAECDPENLVQFAIMGALFARIVLGIREPTIGLLNIGQEEIKGNEVVRAAAASLREMELPGRFIGYVEGDGLPLGAADVVVTDGFTGNVALKTAEGTAKLVTDGLKRVIKASLMARIGLPFMANAFRSFRTQMDPRQYNGAMFLGLGQICVKSHGGTDGFGFAHAIDVAVDLVQQRFNHRLGEELARLSAGAGAATVPPDDAAAGAVAGL